MQANNYNTLIQKIDQFIRKYYINNLIRGTLYTVGVVLALFISFALLEYYYFNSTVSSVQLRKTLFYSFIGITAVTTAWLVFKPLMQYFHLGNVISHERAAQIIGNHFTDVKDRLLNVLQLNTQMSTADSALLQASINQKVETMNPVPFSSAIDLKENKKYLRFALPPLLLLLLLLFTSNIIEDSTVRLINNNREFEKAALFSFKVANQDAKVVQYDNYNLEVKVEGEALPNEVFVEVDNFKYKLEKTSPNTFSYTFVEMRKDTDFRLTANNVISKKYEIDVLEKPQISDFDVKLDYPSYTGRKDESITGIGDLVVPVGTNIEWLFESMNTSNVQVKFPGEDTKQPIKKMGGNTFGVQKRVLQDGRYQVFIANEELPEGDSISYSLTLIPDLYPSIEVKTTRDSLNDKVVYFAGEASDDYGLRGVYFNYTIEEEGVVIKKDKIKMPTSSGKQTVYDYIMNVKELDLKLGQKLSYYFQAFDNDGVKGSKSAKTPLMYYEMPTAEELKEQETANNSEIKKELDNAMKKMQKLGQDIKKARTKVLQKKELNWQDKREMEKLKEQREEVEEQMQNAQDKFEENLKNQEELEEVSEELAKKQEMLQKLFDEIMNDEMKDLFEEMDKLMEEMDQEEMKDQLEEMEMSEDEMEKELDRMLELFKKMEVEKQMEDATKALDSLAKEQEQLSEEVAKQEEAEKEKANEDKDGEKNKDGKKDSAAEKKQEELEKKQEEINKKFEEIMKDIEDAKKKNEDLETPMNMDSEEMEQQKQDAQENMQDASDKLGKKQNKKASKSQKNAAEKMKQMSKEMKSMMQMDQMEKMEQDLKSIRQLLENLVMLSFDQEDLIDQVNKTMPNTPTYIRLVQNQDKIKDDFRHVEDSLQALSKRVFQLEAFITEKVTEVKKNLKESVSTLEERQKRLANVQQQYAMTGLNDLALMLSESMQQMQQQMAQQMPGDQMCEKPGQGKPGGKSGMGKGKGGDKPGDMPGIRQMQEQLNKQIQQLKEQMKNGKMPGNKFSKQFAQMAAKQAAIRKKLQDMKKGNQKQGKGAGKEIQDLIDAMDKVETDLVNKRLPNDMQKRQKDIMTRLLQAENAERERELDEKREAEQPDKYTPKMPPALEEYLKKRQGQVEMFKTVSPSLKPYYKNLVEKYFRALN